LRNKLEEVRRGELSKTFTNLKDLGDRERKAIEALTSAIVNKVLHQPITILKQSQNGMIGENYVDAVRVLFDLEPVQPMGEIKALDDHTDQ
jgi:glutamyl-tRNA reductase